MLSLLFLTLPSLSSAQYCQQDVLVDDFRLSRRLFIDGAIRQANLLDADYGTDNPATTMTVDTVARTMTVYAGTNESFFFAKYNALACFDLRPFTAFQFELEAPVGSSAAFTLTQSNPSCTGRIDDGDSVYLPLSQYYTTPGQRQVVTMPFRDFARNVNGGNFDFVHLKDWTMVSMRPLGANFVFRNMILVGDKSGCVQPTTTTIRSSTTTTTTRSTTTTVAPSSSSQGGYTTSSQSRASTTSSTTVPASQSPTDKPLIGNSAAAGGKLSWTTIIAGVVPILYLAFA